VSAGDDRPSRPGAAPEGFSIVEERLGAGRLVVAVVGEIDLYTAPDLRLALAGAVDSGDTQIVVDLSETAFVDSTGLGVLLGIGRRLRDAGGALAIVNVDVGIAKTFEVTGLDQIFAIRATRDEALDALVTA
jgi:anti-sigma B factor antagonist